ncbi:uncharacterized protein [Fopius arisanus]|uniref:Uncharacterized protein isoform X2 n=1 Tax=Fopius arisanus TaxID=64838 RepID=A0A9R1TMU0_9HYME|nr:PREDICTED: uncharacterized protein LOC105271652 isoform X2 [Fopius arisanus]
MAESSCADHDLWTTSETCAIRCFCTLMGEKRSVPERKKQTKHPTLDSEDEDEEGGHEERAPPLSVDETSDDESADVSTSKELLKIQQNEIAKLRKQLQEAEAKYNALTAVHAACDNVNDENIADIEMGTTKKDVIHIGYNVWIKQTSYDLVCKAAEPSKFINRLAESVWSDQELARSTTRKTKGVDRVLFSPTKKAAVSKCFSKWLRDKFSDEKAKIEEGKLNCYLNRVTDATRKRLEAQSRV